MSTYIQWEEGDPEFLASNVGWGQFCDFANGLDKKGFAVVRQLTDSGVTESLSALVAQLKAAPQASSDVQPIIGTIIQAVANRGAMEVLMVTNGMGSEGNDDEIKSAPSDPLPWTDEELDALSAVSEADIKATLGTRGADMRAVLEAKTE